VIVFDSFIAQNTETRYIYINHWSVRNDFNRYEKQLESRSETK